MIQRKHFILAPSILFFFSMLMYLGSLQLSHWKFIPIYFFAYLVMGTTSSIAVCIYLFLRARANREIKEVDTLKENLKNSAGYVLDKVSYLKSGILCLTINEIEYNIAPAGGAVAGIYNENDKALSNEVGKTITSINIDDFYSIKIKFSSGNIFYIEDDTGGEGLEIW